MCSSTFIRIKYDIIPFSKIFCYRYYTCVFHTKLKTTPFETLQNPIAKYLLNCIGGLSFSIILYILNSSEHISQVWYSGKPLSYAKYQVSRLKSESIRIFVITASFFLFNWYLGTRHVEPRIFSNFRE